MAKQNEKQNVKEDVHLNKKEKKGLKMINFFRKKTKKISVEDYKKKKKNDFIFYHLLSFYEKRLKNQVDLPAFCYANYDMKLIKKENKTDYIYEFIKKIVKGGKNEI